MTIKELRKAIEDEKTRSAWDNGKKVYALELLEDFPEDQEFYASPADKKALLNGADNWSQYSWGGSSLIYDCDIAERLCTLSELKKTHNGERRPNSREEWLDTQARALYQACNRVSRLYRSIMTA